jgi:hypothetical protein
MWRGGRTGQGDDEGVGGGGDVLAVPAVTTAVALAAPAQTDALVRAQRALPHAACN